MEELTSLISNVGFPIVACIFMFIDRQKMTSAVTELTATLKVIDSRIDKLERGEK